MGGFTKLNIDVHRNRVAELIGRDRQPSRRVLVYNSGSLPGAAAKWVMRAMESAIHRRGHCTLVLAGGTAWRSTYELMASRWLADRVSWSSVDVYFGDERCVAPDDARSNYRMAVCALLSHVPISSSSIHRIRAEEADSAAVARDYARQLPTQVDVLLLGVGADGHTASLFPRSTAVAEEVRRVLPVKRALPDVGRITITAPVIRAAREVFVLATGAEKSAAVARALEGPSMPSQLPIQLARGATWLIDRQVARSLQGTYAQPG